MKKFHLIALFALCVMCRQVALADWEKAVSLYKQGQYRPAITEFEQVVAEFPDHSDSWKFIGLAYYQLKDYAPCVSPLEKALALKQKEGKTDTDILQALGRAEIALLRYDRAAPRFETLTRLSAKDKSAAVNYYLLGVCYAQLNRAADSDVAFRQATKLDPNDGDTWYYLGTQQFRAGRFTEAITTLRSGVTAQPKNLEMLGLLAESLLRQAASLTDERKAQTLNEEAVQHATDLRALREDAASLELQGRAFLAAKKYTNAEMTLERAISASTKPTASLFFATGFAHAQSKAWPRAAEMLANADRLQPGDFNTLYYLGYVFENQRKYAQALDAYNRAFEASGRSNTDVKNSIDRVTPLARTP
ncbi:MAG: tetratricopeptide repeat protein [Acidobacteria bacterium]|nr:tetratricopeptide repeat protein [Acidobacteriota bacterium]